VFLWVAVMASSKELRDQGNALFKDGKFEEAARVYSAAATAAGPTGALADSARPDLTSLGVAEKENASLALLNRAACWLKVGKNEAAVTDCSAVLEVDGGNTKALYRRGQAYQSLGQLRLALVDASRWLQLEPKSEAAQAFMRSLRSAVSTPAAAGSAAAAASHAPAGSSGRPAGSSTLPFAECLQLLSEAHKRAGPAVSLTGGAGAPLPAKAAGELGTIVTTLCSSLPQALRIPSNARSFLVKQGPLQLLQLAAAAHAGGEGAAPKQPVLQRALAVVTGVCRNVVAESDHGDAWVRDWLRGDKAAVGNWAPPVFGEAETAAAYCPPSAESSSGSSDGAAADGASATVSSAPVIGPRVQGPELSLPPQCDSITRGLGESMALVLLPLLAPASPTAPSAGEAADDVYRCCAACVAALLHVSAPLMSQQATAFLHAIRKAEASRHKAEVLARQEARGIAKAAAAAAAGEAGGDGASSAASAKGSASAASAPRLLPFAFVTLPRGVRAAVARWARFTVRAVLRTAPKATPIAAVEGGVKGKSAPSSSAPLTLSGVGWDYSAHEYGLRALSQLLALGSEDGVWLLAQAGALDAALALAAALPADVSALRPSGSPAVAASAAATAELSTRARGLATDSAASVRRTAAGCLTRALTSLRDAFPAGYGETGKAKLRLLLRDLLASSGIDGLAAALPFAPAAPAADGSAAAAAPAAVAETAVVGPLPAPDWAPSEATAQATALLSCALLAERLEALQFAEEAAGLAAAVFVTSAAPFPAWQALAVDVVSSLANDEQGRALLSGLADRLHPAALEAHPSTRPRLDVTALLGRLMESRSAAVRSGASITLAKLSSPAKVWTSEGGRRGAHDMISAVLQQLVAAAGLAGPGRGGKRAAAAAAGAGLGGVDEADEDDGEFDEEGAAEGASGLADPLSIPFASMLAALEEQEVAAGGADADGASGAGRPSAHGSSSLGLSGSAPAAPVMLALASTASPATSGASSASTSALARYPVLRTRVDLDSAARAVEALAVLSTHTRTKALLLADRTALAALLRVGAAVCHGLGVQAAAVGGPRHPAKGAATPGGAGAGLPQQKSAGELRPCAYGLAFILYSLTVSRSRQRAEKLSELEIDAAQYRELQKMLAPGKLPGEAASTGEDDEEADPPAAVEGRVKALAATDSVRLLHAITEGMRVAAAGAGAAAGTAAGGGAVASTAAAAAALSGSGVAEMCSRALCNMSEYPPVRGGMVAGGAIKLLLALGGGGAAGAAGAGSSAAPAPALPNSLNGSLAATQALSRLLTTVHSSSIPLQQQLAAIPALLRSLRESPSQLQQFEALLALTNLMGSSEEARQAALERGATEAIEFAQFAENRLLRRAATEALTNLAATEEGSRLITDSRLGLWLALARNFEHGASGTAAAAAPPAPDAKAAGSGAEASSGEAEADTPTAMAAAGGLAMALLHVVGQADAEEGESDLEEEAAAAQRERRHGLRRLDPKTIEAVKAQRAERQRQRRVGAQAAVHRVVDAGGAAVVGELLLSGNPALTHRALVVAGELAKYPRGVAALLSPLLGGAEGSDAGASSSALVAAGKRAAKAAGGEGTKGDATDDAGLSCLALLLLLSEGKDPAALVAGPAAATAGVPPPLKALAATSASRVLEACESEEGRAGLLAVSAATSAPSEPAADREAAKAESLASGAEPAATSTAASPPGSGGGSGPVVLQVRALAPVFPDPSFVKDTLRKLRKG